jgi:hypothetical protein
MAAPTADGVGPVSVGDIVLNLVFGVAAIELSDLAAWLARPLARWAARFYYPRRPDRAATRAQEWVSVIEERPTSILKLVTAASFAMGAITVRTTDTLRRSHRTLVFRVRFREVATGCLFVPFSVAAMIKNPGAMPTWIFLLSWSVMLVIVANKIMSHRRRLRWLMPVLIASEIVTQDEADLVMALLPVRWWQVGARQGVARPVRSAAGALKCALLAMSAGLGDDLPIYGLQPEVVFADAYELATDGSRSRGAKAIRCGVAEVGDAGAWLAEVLV